MKKDFFKPEMFNGIEQRFKQENYAADVANLELQKLIESWPMVYGTKDNNGQHFHENPNGNYNPTLKARIAFIEEIKKDCKHEPFNDSCVPNHFHCKHCGVELQAEWREVKK